MQETASIDRKSFDYLKTDYLPYVYRWGKITGLAGMAICFLPVFALAIFYDFWPQWGAVLTGFVSILGMNGIGYWMTTITFFPLQGTAGTYMANLSGNIQNMRVPCAAAAQAGAGVEPGSAEGEICANIGIAVSTLINISILTAGVIGGTYVMSLMPPVVLQALTYLLPCLTGGVVIMVGWRNKRQLPVSFAIGFLVHLVIIRVFPSLRQFGNLMGILLSITVAVQLYKRKIWK